MTKDLTIQIQGGNIKEKPSIQPKKNNDRVNQKPSGDGLMQLIECTMSLSNQLDPRFLKWNKRCSLELAIPGMPMNNIILFPHIKLMRI